MAYVNLPVKVQALFDFETKSEMVDPTEMQEEADRLYRKFKAVGIERAKVFFHDTEGNSYCISAKSFCTRARAWAGVWISLLYRFDMRDDRLKKHFGLEETIPETLRDVQALYEILNDCPIVENLKITNMQDIMESYLEQRSALK